MQKSFKNKELEEVLSNAKYLGTYPMPGELTLAITAARKSLKLAFEIYTEAYKQIGEARCVRDANDRPVTEYQRDEQGNELVNRPKKLKFKNAAAEQDALQELKMLGEQETSIDVKVIETSVLENLSNITPIQMEAILSLTEIKH